MGLEDPKGGFDLREGLWVKINFGKKLFCFYSSKIYNNP